MSVHGVVGDFTEHLSQLPGEAPRIVAFLGGTIGNLLPAERAKFCRSVRDVLDRERPRVVIHDEELAGLLEGADVPVRLLAWTDSAGDTRTASVTLAEAPVS